MPELKSPSIAFRRDLLGCFALQRLLVWAAVAISTLFSCVKTPLTTTFSDHSPSLFIGFVVILLVLLGPLYRLRNHQISKWFTLSLFSATEAAIWAGFDALLHKDVSLFNCSFTLAWAMTVLLLEVARSGKQSKVASVIVVSRTSSDPNDARIATNSDATRTLSRINAAASYEPITIHIDGPIAFGLVGIASSVLFAIPKTRFLPAMDFGMSLLFQLALVLWFALDLRRLDQILGFGEAGHGVIYIYIDAVLATGYIAMVLAAVGAMVIFIAGFAMAGPAGKGCGGGGCTGGCGNYCECKCSRYRSLFRDSKCLFFNEEGSSFDCCDSPPDEMPTIADLSARRLELQGSNLDQTMQRV